MDPSKPRRGLRALEGDVTVCCSCLSTLVQLFKKCSVELTNECPLPHNVHVLSPGTARYLTNRDFADVI